VSVDETNVGHPNSWMSAILGVGFAGDNGAEADAAISALTELLRSGEPMPPEAAAMLAELIDGKDGLFSRRLCVKVDKRKLAQDEKGAFAIAVGFDIERMVEETGMSTTNAVKKAAEKLGKDELSTVWRYWSYFLSVRDHLPSRMEFERTSKRCGHSQKVSSVGASELRDNMRQIGRVPADFGL
jgi:hypothetical protein